MQEHSHSTARRGFPNPMSPSWEMEPGPGCLTLRDEPFSGMPRNAGVNCHGRTPLQIVISGETGSGAVTFPKHGIQREPVGGHDFQRTDQKSPAVESPFRIRESHFGRDVQRHSTLLESNFECWEVSLGRSANSCDVRRPRGIVSKPDDVGRMQR